MKRIILHWTAGGQVPNSHEKECYHFLVDAFGKVRLGIFKPEANLICKPNMYAPHTGGGNTGSVGVALCGMMGFKDKNHLGSCPITRIQFESAMKLCAKLALKYEIPIKSTTIMTHYEFGKSHPETSSHGKIDISFLPPFSWLEKDEIGRFIRSKIKWYLNQITANKGVD